jgi:hypothetical protein
MRIGTEPWGEINADVKNKSNFQKGTRFQRFQPSDNTDDTINQCPSQNVLCDYQSMNVPITCRMKVMGLFPMACASPMFALITLAKGFFTPASSSWFTKRNKLSVPQR